MQLVTYSQQSPSMAGDNVAEVSAVSQSAYPDDGIIRRNGAAVGFDPGKISVAMTKAFLAIEGGQETAPAASADELLRIRIEYKRIINGRTSVNQLVPFKYKWA